MDRLEQVKEELICAAEEEYKEFQKSLIPGPQKILGVRMPKVRQIAKDIAKKEFREYLEQAKFGITADSYYEELLVEGCVIGYGKMSLESRFAYLDALVPKINNWAVCDCCCSTYKFMQKAQEESFAYLQKWLNSDKEYELRFGIVSLLDHFVNEDYIDSILDICNEIHHEGYYVKMAAAWALSVCYVKFPEKTERLLRNNQMDDFTHNKTIQKIRGSFRVDKERKERIKLLKR